jgi:predicted nucleotidyltransferase
LTSDPVLRKVCDDLVTVHGAHTILLYGSRADGSATHDSDYDLAAFAPTEKTMRDARLMNGAYLDIFVYPESMLKNPGEELLKLRGSRVILQRVGEADAFLRALDQLFERGPERLPPDEIQARKIWALKMASRSQRGDTEGNFRRAWLLVALLEDYFLIRGRWYQGPKKALLWLQECDPATWQAFSSALQPNASQESINNLATHLAHRDA